MAWWTPDPTEAALRRALADERRVQSALHPHTGQIEVCAQKLRRGYRSLARLWDDAEDTAPPPTYENEGAENARTNERERHAQDCV